MPMELILIVRTKKHSGFRKSNKLDHSRSSKPHVKFICTTKSLVRKRDCNRISNLPEQDFGVVTISGEFGTVFAQDDYVADARFFATRNYHTASAQFPKPSLAPVRASFATGSPLMIRRNHERKTTCKAIPVLIRCEQNTKDGNGLDVWLGRVAMVGFAVAITVEITSGKGLLENFGLTSPLPTVALAITGLVGVLTEVYIFQSASEN